MVCGLRTRADWTTPSYLAIPGLLAGEVLGKRDLSCSFYWPGSPLAAAQVEPWLEGHAAPTQWLSLYLLAISRMLCSDTPTELSVSDVVLQTLSDSRPDSPL